MSNASKYLRPAPVWRLRRSVATGTLAGSIWAAAMVSPLTAQDPGPFRLWAAQTGRDQVSLAWEAVPGAAEYRIYLGDPGVPGTLAQRPASALSASGRSAILTGTQRLASGITLVAVDASGRVLRQESFNPVFPATSFPPPTPPAGLTAEAPSASEVMVTWDPVPGATAYLIGRSVFRSGFSVLCALCSTEPRYVDRSVTAGQPHTYTIAAIFPSGTSTRVSSNSVTPGETATTTTVTPPGQPAGAITTTSGTPTGSTTSGASPAAGTPTSSTTSGTTPTTSTPTSSPLGGALAAVGNVFDAGADPPTSVTATVAGPAEVRVNWQPSTTAGVTNYVIQRRVNGGFPQMLNVVAATVRTYADTFFPATFFASGPLRVTYAITSSPGGKNAASSNEVLVQPPVTGGGTSPAVTSCRLDYQRADNMWAASGRPDGPLGTESISLAAGQGKVFITDWKYEKLRNDGTNFYGSHLRIASNPTSHTIRLHLRTGALTGLVVLSRTGSDTFWTRLDPNTSKLLQADLMEVFCEG